MDDLLGIDAFASLAREGSYTAAARRLGVPRSTVSRRVARLEESLGRRLVDRTTRSVRLTEAGRVLLERVRPVLGELSAIRDELAQLDDVPRGTLRAAIPPGLGREWWIAFALQFRERYPSVRIQVVYTTRRVHLIDDDYDLLLTDEPVEDAAFIARRIAVADRLLVASPQYLEARGTPCRVAELAAHHCLAVAEPHDGTLDWPLLSGGSVAVRPVITSNDVSFVHQATLAGAGIALLSVIAAVAELASGQLVPVLPGKVGERAELVAVYASRAHQSPKIRALMELMLEYAAMGNALLGEIAPRTRGSES